MSMIAITEYQRQWNEQNPLLAMRGIDESTWGALNSTIYPGAKPDSILLAIDYCRARGLDVMLKPVHLVPMNVKNAQTGNYEWRDVPMPGVGLYRIQAERSGTYAGADAPEFGPTIEKSFKGGITVSFPEWCRYTVHKIVGDRVVSYTAVEYWEENYATAGKDTDAPNAMWKKRPRGQIAKCAEAQALRKGWPEIGQEPTAEEMEGKTYDIKDVTPARSASPVAAALNDARITPDQCRQLLEAAAFVEKDEAYICKMARISQITDLQAARFDGALKHLKGLAIPAANSVSSPAEQPQDFEV